MNEILDSPVATRGPGLKANKNTSEAAELQPPTPEEYSGFGQTLRALRLEHKLSAAAMALKCGLSASAINKIEQGLFKPSCLVAAKIDGVLGSDLLARFGGQLRGGFADEPDQGGREPESNTVIAINKLSLKRKNLKRYLEIQPDIKVAPLLTKPPEFAMAKPQLDMVLEIMSQTTEAVLRLTSNLDNVMYF